MKVKYTGKFPRNVFGEIRQGGEIIEDLSAADAEMLVKNNPNDFEIVHEGVDLALHDGLDAVKHAVEDVGKALTPKAKPKKAAKKK